MAAHAVSTASLWSIAAVLACDRCGGVKRGWAVGGLCSEVSVRSGALAARAATRRLFTMILLPRRRAPFLRRRRVEQLAV